MDRLSSDEDVTQDNLRAIRLHYAAFARGDVDELLAGLDPEVLIRVHDEHGVRTGEAIHGRESARAFFEGIAAAVTDSAVEIEDLRANGDRVLARVHIGGTLKESGRSGAIPAVHLFLVCDGLIAEILTHRPDWRRYEPEP